jgi:hypothetical protein
MDRDRRDDYLERLDHRHPKITWRLRWEIPLGSSPDGVVDSPLSNVGTLENQPMLDLVHTIRLIRDLRTDDANAGDLAF